MYKCNLKRTFDERGIYYITIVYNQDLQNSNQNGLQIRLGLSITMSQKQTMPSAYYSYSMK